ncbi:MAG: type II secretion system protein [Planctomycetota bacterium]|jgi:prepilin-type N-terminal cleavage/methylation domain-containing protein/prepilin-type processing-associated H-X9-DG protein
MKRKGFTLIELLVVIAIIALLMSILMPALARVKELANRVVCGSNLSGLGKAVNIYGNEDENGRFPRAGGRNSKHGPLGGAGGWTGVDEVDAFGAVGNNTATITSSLWLLVKGDYATTKQFVCKSDPDTTGVFKHSNPWEVWDFGTTPGEFCSYSYHNPYDDADGFSYGLTGASNPAMPVCADRNPGDGAVDNSRAHQDEGQNVMFVDGHVDFEKNEGGRRGRDCGINNDDIYTDGDGTYLTPLDRYDAVLLNE